MRKLSIFNVLFSSKDCVLNAKQNLMSNKLEMISKKVVKVVKIVYIININAVI